MLTSIAIILLLGLTMGWIFSKLRLPSLMGMVIVGIVLSPHCLNLVDESILMISGDLRQIALVIILTRAGLSLNIEDLKKVGRPAILMCFVPACIEMIGTIIFAPILLGVSVLDAAIMGSVIAAVSPAVIVPRMIKLMEEGYGKGKSIPQMILAGASVDDVFVVVVFALIFRMIGVVVSLVKTELLPKEKLFCAMAYTPKATVQAAIGTIPMAMGLECGSIVLTVAVVAILLTAPFGAICVDNSYKKLLEKA